MSGNGFTWGKLIRQLREEQKLSQRLLCVRAHINRQTLRKIESGEIAGSMDTIERALHYLGYELEAMARVNAAERLKYQRTMEDDPSRKSKLAASRLMILGPRTY